jgi:hypothetical protein
MIKGLEIREWSREQLQQYVDTLRMVISMFDDFPNTSVSEFRVIFQDCIDRELENAIS